MNEKRSGLTGIRVWWLAFTGGLFVLALITGVLFNPGYMFRSASLRNIFTNCGPTMLVCAAMAIPFSRGHVDFSALGVGCLSSVLIGVFSSSLGTPDALSVLLAVVISACLGLVNGLIAMTVRRKNPLFMAVVTAALGYLYRQIAYAITNGMPIPTTGLRMPTTGVTMFLLPAVVLVGVFALFAFTKGKRDFNGVYEKEEDRNRSTIASFLLSGVLAGLAAVLMIIRVRAAMSTAFSINSSYILVLAAAGVAIPNVKKSKGGAFVGYITLILAALAVSVLQMALTIANVNPYAQYIVYAVPAVVFVILNAVLGSKAAKIEYVPAEKTAAPVSGGNVCGNAANAYAATGKNKVCAALLAIFLGQIGVHRYYLGYKKQGGWMTAGFVCAVAGFVIEGPAIYENSIGLIILALVLLLCGLAVAIIALVDFIRILTNKLYPVYSAPAADARPSYISEPAPAADEAKPAPAVNLTKKPEAEPAPAHMPTSAQLAALEELTTLYQEGVITEELYNRRKRDIMSRL